MSCTTTRLPKKTATAVRVPGTSASPGFQYGRAGAVGAGTYLQVMASVPSSTAGNIVPFNGVITRAFVTAEADATFTIKVQKRTDPGPVFVDLSTLTMVAQRRGSFALAVSVVDGDELVVLLDTGSASNLQVGLIIEQS